MDNKIKVSKEKKDEMITSIKVFFTKERDEDLGYLAAEMILDFFIDELAPDFYNQGVNDSYVYLKDKIEDLFGIQIYKR